MSTSRFVSYIQTSADPEAPSPESNSTEKYTSYVISDGYTTMEMSAHEDLLAEWASGGLMPWVPRQELKLFGAKELEWSYSFGGFIDPDDTSGSTIRYSLPPGTGTVVYAVQIVGHHSAALIVDYDKRTVVDADFLRSSGLLNANAFFKGWSVQTLPCPWITPLRAREMVTAKLQRGYSDDVVRALQALQNPNWFPKRKTKDDQNKDGLCQIYQAVIIHWFTVYGNTNLMEEIRRRSLELAMKLFGASGLYLEAEIVLAGLLHNYRAKSARFQDFASHVAH
jgi:hypothetical protein